MKTAHSRLARLVPAVLAVALVAPRPASISTVVSAAPAERPDEAAVVHVLNRMTFGPRPGDVEKVSAMGLKAYIDEQLHPERIPDSAMAGRLAGLKSLDMSRSEIFEQYEQPQLEMRRERQEMQKNGAPPNEEEMKEQVRAMRQAAQMQGGGGPLPDLSQAKMLRAVYSDRQLQEVLTDFWFNHFNVDARKGRTRFMLTEYERDAIRPHVFGKFRDLLEATAKSPAMLFYLDNWMSVDPNGPHPTNNQRPRFNVNGRGRRGRLDMPQNRRQLDPQMQQALQNRQRRGLNENYGRELMELHTLGVDGGYTQKDVTEVARAFTGWTIAPPRLGDGGFQFQAALHDEGEKVVLGHKIKAGGGMKDGEQVLDILASHPATARHIATQLARRFVSDEPPASLVDRLAERFRETDGDLREVMRTLLTSQEFMAPEARRAKVKTPLEFVVSAVRATGAELPDGRLLVGTMQQLGMPLYQCQPPTGYKDTADAWTNTGALVSRMNFAAQLASNRQVSMRLPARDALLESILGADVSDTTRATVGKAASVPQMVALTLGSPEFQRR